VAAQAFEPFFTTKPAGRASGLGLSQAYGFAAQSGGAIALESAPGRGTTVTLVLPTGPGHAPCHAPAPCARPAAQPARGEAVA